MKKTFLFLTCILMLCSMSDCEKDNAYYRSNALDFNFTTAESGSGTLFTATADDLTERQTGDRTLLFGADVHGESLPDGLSVTGITISLGTRRPIEAGMVYSHGNDGTSLKAILEYSGEDGMEHSAESSGGTLKTVIQHDRYAAGTFCFNFSLPVYGPDGSIIKTEPCRITDGFFSIYMLHPDKITQD